MGNLEKTSGNKRQKQTAYSPHEHGWVLAKWQLEADHNKSLWLCECGECKHVEHKPHIEYQGITNNPDYLDKPKLKAK